MHLIIDIRFYRPEAFGLAVYIRDLFTELVPLFIKDKVFQKVTLIMTKEIANLDLQKHLTWWPTVQENPKFCIYFSDCKYYSISEQTLLLYEIYKLKPNLVFFFNFNFPILYNKPFVYQVLDLTIPKIKPKGPKLFLANLVLKQGLKKAKQIIFLGKQTAKEAQEFSKLNFFNKEQPDYKPNTPIYPGINPLYLSQPSANPQKAEIIGLSSTKKYLQKAKTLKNNLAITKNYFLFVSVWRKYKNVERLVEGFEIFNEQQKDQYQLVLAGKVDPKYPEIMQRVKASQQYQQGNIILALEESDEKQILLQDQALAYISPSLSEGFGLTLIEAASRGTLVLCSDIQVFREIIPAKAAIFFDPYSSEAIYQSFKEAIEVTSNPKLIQQIIKLGHKNSQKYTWQKTAKNIYQVLLKSV